jgi:general transcription factor 3C polypeptide 5 (transcription factor C subunit 1)
MGELIRVEFPGFVKDRSKATGMLGGGQTLYKQFSSTNPVLRVSFRPGDPLAHCVSSEVIVDPCFVIRIKVVRRFRRTSPGRQLVSTSFVSEVIGSAISFHAFRSPCDLQFLPSLTSPLNETTVNAPPDMVQSFLYLPPPIFIHNNKYGAHYIQKRIFSSQQGDSTKLWKDRGDWLVNQNDLIALEHGPRPLRRPDSVSDEMLAIFCEMFDTRPIWTSVAIYDHLVTVNEQRANILDICGSGIAFFRALSCVAYHIKTGPFKVCWVRYGVNPLLDPSFRMYQVVIISLREWQYAEELQKRMVRKSTRYISKNIRETPIGMSRAWALPDRLYFGLQLIDIDHPVITDLLAQSQDQYSLTSGWFVASQISAVRDFVMLTYQRMMIDPKGEAMAKVLMADITSTEQVKQELGSIRPKKSTGEVFDFELINEVQGILGIYDSSGTETIQDLLDVITRKTCALSIDRALS